MGCDPITKKLNQESPTAQLLERDGPLQQIKGLRERGEAKAKEHTSCHPKLKELYNDNKDNCELCGSILYLCRMDCIGDAICWACCCGAGFTGDKQGGWQSCSRCERDGAFEVYGCQTVCCRFCCEAIPPFGD